MIGFSEWAEHHGTIFGLFDPKHVEMIASWQSLFDASGYTAEELEDATAWLAMHGGHLKPWDHLEAIRRRLSEARAVTRQAAQTEADHGDCSLCGNTGRVIVPHRGGVANGRWLPQAGTATPQRYTEAVSCICSRGRFGIWTAQDRRTGQLVAMTTLEQYEQINPHWRRQMAMRDREQVEMTRLNPVRPELAAVMNRILSRVQTRQPGDEE